MVLTPHEHAPMNSRTRPALALAAAALLFSSPDALAKGPDQKGKADLTRPADGPDPDAKGEIEIEKSKKPGGESEFEIEVENVDVLLVHELWMEEPAESGLLVYVADLEVDDDDDDGDDPKLKYEAESGDDDDDDDDDEEEEGDDDDDDAPLPFDATSVDDLIGRAVEIRQAGAVVLQGVVPELGQKGKGKGKGGNGKGQATAYLVRPDDVMTEDDDGKGRVRLEIFPTNGRQRFRVDVEDIETSAGLDLWLEDSVGAGTYSLVGPFEIDDDGDDEEEEDDDGDDEEARYEADTQKGDPLPGGVNDLSDLDGRGLEVRAVDTVVLIGTVPGFDAPKKPSSDKVDMAPTVDAPPKAKSRLRLVSKKKNGDERFLLKAKRLDKEVPAYTLFLETAPGSSVFEDAGDLERKGKGKNGLYRRFTKKGEALPGDEVDVAGLAGRRLEVRDDQGTVIFEALLPSDD